MYLNSSGQISLAGTVCGQSVAQALYIGTGGINGPTSTISINCSNVRALAGVFSCGSQISFSNLYNKNGMLIANSGSTYKRFNICGNLVGSTVSGTTRIGQMGAGASCIGLFYGGWKGAHCNFNGATKINACGTTLSENTGYGTSHFYGGGAGIQYVATYYGGQSWYSYQYTTGGSPSTSGTAWRTANQNYLTRINFTCASSYSQSTYACGRTCNVGVSFRSAGTGMFWGGGVVYPNNCSCNPPTYNGSQLIRFNVCGTALTNTFTGYCSLPNHKIAGAGVNNVGLFFGGYPNAQFATTATSIHLARISCTGSFLSFSTISGFCRSGNCFPDAGAIGGTVGSVGIFFAGYGGYSYGCCGACYTAGNPIHTYKLRFNQCGNTLEGRVYLRCCGYSASCAVYYGVASSASI